MMFIVRLGVVHRHIGGLEMSALLLLLNQGVHRHIGGLENFFKDAGFN